MNEVFNICPCQEILPVRMKARKESQVNSPDKQEEQQHPKKDMCKPHISHEEFVYRFTLGNDKRFSNIEAGDNQDKNRESHGPVVDPYGDGPLSDAGNFFHGILLSLKPL
jgi:hypothetical protein